RPGPGSRVSEIRTGRVDRVVIGPSFVVDFLVEQVPLLVWGEVKDLGGAEVLVAELEDVARGTAGVLEVGKGEVLDLTSTFLTADRAEDVPAVAKADNRWVLDAVAGVLRPLGRPDQRGAQSPLEPAREEVIEGQFGVEFFLSRRQRQSGAHAAKQS